MDGGTEKASKQDSQASSRSLALGCVQCRYCSSPSLAQATVLWENTAASRLLQAHTSRSTTVPSHLCPPLHSPPSPPPPGKWDFSHQVCCAGSKSRHRQQVAQQDRLPPHCMTVWCRTIQCVMSTVLYLKPQKAIECMRGDLGFVSGAAGVHDGA